MLQPTRRFFERLRKGVILFHLLARKLRQMDGRIWDRGAVLILALVCATCLVAMTIGSCDTREQRRAAEVAAAQSRARSIAEAMPASIDDTTREQARQRLAIEALEQRVAGQREAFNDYKDFTVYGITAVGGLVALVGILFPVGLYLVSIRPGEKVVEEARQLIGSGLDVRFQELLNKQTIEQTTRAVEQIRSGDANEQTYGLMYFSLNPGLQLKDQQLFELVEVLRAAPVTTQGQLANILCHYPSSYVTRALGDILNEQSAPYVLHPILRHCLLPETGALRGRLKEFAASPAGRKHATTLLQYASMSFPGVIDDLINDADWIARLPAWTRTQCLMFLRASLKMFNRAVDLDASELARSLAGVHYAPMNAAIQEVAVADADRMMIIEDGVHKGTLVRGSKAFDDAAKGIESGAKS